MSIRSPEEWTGKLGANLFTPMSRRRCGPSWIANLPKGWCQRTLCAILLLTPGYIRPRVVMPERAFATQSKRGLEVVMTAEDDVALTHLLRENFSPLELIAVDFLRQQQIGRAHV